ncbi:MAG: hypothetical protein P8J27_17045 [Mariniblastus sp.]|nr:hypothetical protein [Mariniblastus sp.]
MVHVKLKTEKYWRATVKSECEKLRREKNRLAIRALMQFSFAALVTAGTFYALATMPEWLPSVAELMEKNGITERLHAIRAWLT